MNPSASSSLVEFARRELPPQSPWANAGSDFSLVGVPLDRLYGDPGEIFVAGIVGDAEVTLPASDPLVVLQTLADGLILPPVMAAETVVAADFGAACQVVATPDSAWDQTDIDWTYDALG